MDRREIWAMAGVAVGGVTAILLIEYFRPFRRQPELSIAVGFCLPLVYGLVVAWISGSRSSPPRETQRVRSRAPFLFFVLAWAAVTLGGVAELGRKSDTWHAAAGGLVVLVVFAGFYWIAVTRLGLRPARFSAGRIAAVGSLALLAALLHYGSSHWRGPWDSVAGIGWVLATVALFRALLRRQSKRGPDG